MPKIRIDEEQLAVARVLESLNWTHSRIGRVFHVEHSTITHALRNRKTHLPGRLEEASAELMATTIARVDRAIRRTTAAELRAIATELEQPTSTEPTTPPGIGKW